jgi:hypothetical protein
MEPQSEYLGSGITRLTAEIECYNELARVTLTASIIEYDPD